MRLATDLRECITHGKADLLEPLGRQEVAICQCQHPNLFGLVAVLEQAQAEKRSWRCYRIEGSGFFAIMSMHCYHLLLNILRQAAGYCRHDSHDRPFVAPRPSRGRLMGEIKSCCKHFEYAKPNTKHHLVLISRIHSI